MNFTSLNVFACLILGALQEFCQKKDYAVPIYSYEEIGGGFKCNVFIPELNIVMSGDVHIKKKNAKKSAAFKAHTQILVKKHFQALQLAESEI